MDVIDLCDEEKVVSFPVAARVSRSVGGCTDIIDLVSSDDEEQGALPAVTPKRPLEAKAEPVEPKRARAAAAPEDGLADAADDDPVEVAPPPPSRAAPEAAAATAGDRDEVQITAHSGALSDFPHSREHCTAFPLEVDPLKRCANCFCYVYAQRARSLRDEASFLLRV